MLSVRSGHSAKLLLVHRARLGACTSPLRNKMMEEQKACRTWVMGLAVEDVIVSNPGGQDLALRLLKRSDLNGGIEQG